MKFPITVAIGVDLVKILRIGTILAKPSGPKFLDRVLHSCEKIHAASLAQERLQLYVAGCWAMKEAIYKTLPSASQRDFTFSQWYRYQEEGRPLVGSNASRSDQFQLSLTHDTDYLVATVLRQELLDLSLIADARRL